jgi:hypothetical protein
MLTLYTWCVILLFFYLLSILDHNIWYQSSRSWGFTATYEKPSNFLYNFFYTEFHKEPLGRFLVDGYRYVGLKFQFQRPYNFRDIACII